MCSEKIFEIRNLGKIFTTRKNEKVIFEDFNIHINKGEFIAFLGPSGCGKSTLLEMIAGFDKDYSGDLLFNGERIKDTSRDRAVVFQKDALFPWLSVYDNIAYGLKMKNMKVDEMRKNIDLVLEKVRLTEYGDYFPEELSGGMKQRVALARILVLRPKMLLMDEPFGALDSFTRLEMQKLLMEIKDDFSPTIIFVTHDIDEALLLADRILLMNSEGNRNQKEIIPGFVRTYDNLSNKMMDENYMKYRNEIIKWFH